MSAELAAVPRVARAALVLGAVLSLGACEKDSPQTPTNNPPQQPNINDHNAVAAIYGGPPLPDVVAPTQPEQPAVADSGVAAAEPDPGGPAAIYGAPPPPSEQSAPPRPSRPPTSMMTRYGAPPLFDESV